LVQTHAGDTSQLFKGDSVSFEFGTAQPRNNDTALEAGDRHVLIGPTFGDPAVISGINLASGSAFVRGTNSIQGLRAAVESTDHGYLIEASVPWSTLGVSAAKAGAEFGMNLNVSEAVANGSRKGELNAMASNNSRRKGNDAQFRSIWGTLALQG
ncbi:MAG: sugar-binding protein, partial [Lapillicoccus sp.]